MVVLCEAAAEAKAEWREYLQQTRLLPSLECGLEEMLRACADASRVGKRRDPINFLASWLMRHNPRHNPRMAERLEEMAATAEERRKREMAEIEAYEAERRRIELLQAAQANATAAAMEQASLNAGKEALRPFMELHTEGGFPLLLRVWL